MRPAMAMAVVELPGAGMGLRLAAGVRREDLVAVGDLRVVWGGGGAGGKGNMVRGWG